MHAGRSLARQDDGPLMVDNLPIASRAPPNCGSPRNSLALEQSVSHEIIVGSDLLTSEIFNFASVLGYHLVSLFENVQDELPTDSAARCSGFPKIGSHQLVEIFASRAKLRPMKNRFARHQFPEHFI